jgi:hypothetical protein
MNRDEKDEAGRMLFSSPGVEGMKRTRGIYTPSFRPELSSHEVDALGMRDVIRRLTDSGMPEGRIVTMTGLALADVYRAIGERA